MNNNWKYYIGIVFVALLFILANSVYIVNQAEQAIVLQFGEPVRLVKEPGLKFKIPFIQNVTLYDTRLLNLDPPAQEVVLNDKNVWTSTVLPVTKSLIRSSFTRRFAQNRLPAANWKKSLTLRCAKFSAELRCRSCFHSKEPKLCATSATRLKSMPRKSA